jgi:hypothetical protein
MLNILDRDARQQAATSLMSGQSHLSEELWDWRGEAFLHGPVVAHLRLLWRVRADLAAGTPALIPPTRIYPLLSNNRGVALLY